MKPIEVSLIEAGGWKLDADSGIGPTPPSTYTLVDDNGLLVLTTKGIAGKYCDWMAQHSEEWPKGTANIQLVTKFTLSAGSTEAIQALEMGNRPTSATGFTGNGQVQANYSRNPLTMEFDIVPSAAGGWAPTGIVLPKFTEGVEHEQVLTYLYDPAEETFSVTSIGVDGETYPVPKNLQNVKMASIGWRKGRTVVGYQPDDNTKGLQFEIKISEASLLFS